MKSMKWGGCAFVVFLTICQAQAPARADNAHQDAAGSPGPWAMLAGHQLAPNDLAKIRGEGTVTITDSMNTTNNQLNVTSSSSGTVNGSVSAATTTGNIASNTIDANSGLTNVLSNTGNNVMMNASTAIYIDAK
jgi:hypothetical protein